MKLIPARVSAKDAAAGQVRLVFEFSKFATATAKACASGEFVELSDEERSAFLSVSSGCAVPLQVKEGEYPPVPVVADAVRGYLKRAKRCDCGKLRKFGHWYCDSYINEYFRKRIEKSAPPPPLGDLRPRVRGKDEREDTRETKYGS